MVKALPLLGARLEGRFKINLFHFLSSYFLFSYLKFVYPSLYSRMKVGFVSGSGVLDAQSALKASHFVQICEQVSSVFDFNVRPVGILM